jgi:hypothetical protein
VENSPETTPPRPGLEQALVAARGLHWIHNLSLFAIFLLRGYCFIGQQIEEFRR